MDSAGERVRIYMLEVKGFFTKNRTLVGWLLLAIYLILPWLSWNGHQILLFDVVERRLSLAGHHFWPSELSFFLPLVLAGAIFIFAITSLWGRIWCGWACPQTLMLHFLAEPIERIVEGKASRRKANDKKGFGGERAIRKVIKHVLFILVGMHLGNTFLSYFVGTDQVAAFVSKPPTEHPFAFGVMMIICVLIYADFAFFREIVCTVMCPYARFQSVLTDPKTLQVGYDVERGEPRTQKKKKGAKPLSVKDAFGATEKQGDCIGCDMCVRVCPTGIDIRDGVQLECIGCARCADACDQVMTRTGKEKGLVGYRREMPDKNLRLRPIIYSSIIFILLSIAVYVFSNREPYRIDLIRKGTLPYLMKGDSVLSSQVFRYRNRLVDTAFLKFPIEGAVNHSLKDSVLAIAPGDLRTWPILFIANKKDFNYGRYDAQFQLSLQGEIFKVPVRLTGPK